MSPIPPCGSDSDPANHCSTEPLDAAGLIKPPDPMTVAGCGCIFASAFFFYMATVAVKWSRLNGLEIDPAFFALVRFVLGFFTVLTVMVTQKKSICIKNRHFLIGRAFFNCLAVYCFFNAVVFTSVAQANILNMSYPIFVALLSWLLLGQKPDRVTVIIVVTAFTGVWLILNPVGMDFNISSLWGVGSGVFAAGSILYLNLARREHDPHTTLFVMFGFGSVLLLAVFYPKLYWPDTGEALYLFFSSALAIAGQYLLTIGFKYVTATEGGVISSTRILIAAAMGPFVAAEPFLGPAGWVGAGLIFSANVYLTIKKARGKK